MNIKFEKVSPKHQKTIFSWLEEDHVKEFWDNSQEHKDDIINFIDGRIVPSSYFGGMFYYWIGLIDEEAYCLVMSHEENEATNSPEHYKPYFSRSGKTFSLDFCIGNKKYLGKGLASLTLVAFIEYFSKNIEPKANTFIIDPNEDNPRATHVYKKAGFKPVAVFKQEGGYFDEKKCILMVKKNYN